MLDTPSLAGRIAEVLAPALPFLIGKPGGTSGQDPAARLGDAAWTLAQGLWTRLRPAIDASSAAQQTAAQVGENPSAPGAQAALAFQLQALIRSDAALAQQLADLLPTSARPSSGGVIASGARSVAIGGNATGSQIVAGDSNSVESVQLRDIINSQGVGFGHAQVSVGGAGTVDPQALVTALAELQAALGQSNLPAGERMVAQTAAGNAALEGVKDGQINADVVKQNAERIGATLKSANAAIQEGSTLWTSVQRVATVLGPLVGGARVVAAWFGIPLPV